MGLEEEWIGYEGHKPGERRLTTQYVEKQDVAQQLAQASRTYEATKQQIKYLLNTAYLGQAMSMDGAKIAVKDCVDRVLHNPNAILWLTRLKHQD